MFRKLREQLYVNNHFKLPLNELITRLKSIRNISDVLAICPQPTENSWRGVLTATTGLFPDSTLQIPQYYSHSVYTNVELKQFAIELNQCKFQKIVFSGFPFYFQSIIEYLWEFGFRETHVIYHGSFSSNREDAVTTKMLYTILMLARNGKINRLGFVKKGMSETIERLTGVKATHIRLFTNVPQGIKPIAFDNNCTNIGVFTHDQYRKNIDNQIAAALMVQNANVHTRRNYDYAYTFSENRLIYHPYFNSYNEFLSLLAGMSVNLYISFSECFGQVITESMALGVPCLASDNSGIFDFDHDLKSLLVVKEFDDSHAICCQIENLLSEATFDKERLKSYVKLLNSKARESVSSFLDD
ncbi:MAG: glycosyltransferase [Bacteroidales bacterium]|nr:glycosyltransferase [Bacteroidales bacterium]